MTENDLSYLIRGAIFRVYNTLGPGLLESVYELALFYELSLLDLTVEKQVALPIRYGDIIIDGGYRNQICGDPLAPSSQTITHLSQTRAEKTRYSCKLQLKQHRRFYFSKSK